MRLSIGAWVGGLCLALAPVLGGRPGTPLRDPRVARSRPAAPPNDVVGGRRRVRDAARRLSRTCEEDFPYRHAGAVLADHRLPGRILGMDAGAEVPLDAARDRAGRFVRTTHIDAVAQFRPWASQGFFLKGGAGMGVRAELGGRTRSGLVQRGRPLSVIIGAGMGVRPTARVGLQVFGARSTPSPWATCRRARG